MKILFLDDDKNRWDTFRRRVPAAYWVETAKACVETIKEWDSMDWLFLDHDLGGEAWVNSSREDCGMEVVRFLCANPYQDKIKNIVVHSHNVVAARSMFDYLKENKYNVSLYPFYTLIQSMNYTPEVTNDIESSLIITDDKNL
jgi:hypothetical protein